MKQFWESKRNYPDSILLFRMGDFYETFENDAQIASKVLGITLTKRSNGAASAVPLAGFPYHALDQHLHKLLHSGYRVAICEQVEDPKKAKGIVKREVVEVVTPGTAVNDHFLNHNENNYLACIFIEKNIVGISLIDHSTGEFIVATKPINKLQDTIDQFSPSEILIPESMQISIESILGKRYLFTQVPDWQFDLESCYLCLNEHFKTQNLKGFGINKNDISVIVCGVTLSYLSKNCKSFTSHITSLRCLKKSGIMNLDSVTIRNLELFKPLNGDNKESTLIDVLDKTITAGGGRKLRRWLMRPLTKIDKIKKRQNICLELIENLDLNESIKLKLKNVSDMERILAKLSQFRANPRDVWQLSISLESTNKIKKQICSFNQKDLLKLIENLPDLNLLVKQIQITLIDNPTNQYKKGGYIKDGFNVELDKLRQISEQASQWMLDYQNQQRLETKINNLKIKYNRVFGYFIEITKIHQNKVPDNYIRKQTLTNAERYFTPELKEFEENFLSASEKIQDLEQKLFAQLREYILVYTQSIQESYDLITTIDVLSNFAYISNKNNYCKPQISASREIDLKASRHPVIEQLLPIGEKFIPNDVVLSNSEKQIALITGPNMAGKSTYLRQIGLNILMAQLGCFIAAEKAKIGIVDQIFTRVGASDNLAGGESTFLVEMNETANILNNTTDRSLILMDEIGRGTSTYDGLSIAWAVIEYIHNHKQCAAKTLFATHYHELVKLAEDLPKAFNLNVKVKEHQDRIIFMRKIINGGADKSYGIDVAEMAGMPKNVIIRANQILQNLMKETTPETRKNPEQSNQLNLLKNNAEIICQELKKIDINTITPLQALKKLSDLKEKNKQ